MRTKHFLEFFLTSNLPDGCLEAMTVFVSLQLEESLLEGMVEHGPFVLSGPNLLTVAGNLTADPG